MFGDLSSFLKKTREITVLLFLKQLASLIEGGLSVVEALLVLEEQATNKRFKRIIHSIRRDVESGLPLSAAMNKHPGAFSDFVVKIAKTGEMSGMLDVILKEIARHMEESAEFRRKIKSAMMYPAVLVVTTIGVIFLMVNFVIPKIMPFIAMQGGQIPWNTQLLIDLNNYWEENFLKIIAYAVGIFGLFFIAKFIPFIRRVIDR